MRFYEFEAKQLLAKSRIPLVQSEVANTAEEAEKIASTIGGPVILKAQAIAPGLAAASTREVSDPGAAKAAAAELLGIDDGGRKPRGILVEACIGPERIADEPALTVDRLGAREAQWLAPATRQMR